MKIDQQRFNEAAVQLEDNYAWQIINADLVRRRDASLVAVANTLSPEDKTRFEVLSEIVGFLPGFGSPKGILASYLKPVNLSKESA